MPTPDDLTSIRALWADYNATVLPASAGTVQRTETRRAFYAGAKAMLTLVEVGSHAATEDEGVKFLEALNLELRQFADLLRAGGA